MASHRPKNPFLGHAAPVLEPEEEPVPALSVPEARSALAPMLVLVLRHGPVIRGIRVYRGPRVDEIAGLVREEMAQAHPDGTVVEAIGVGAGVYDLLRHTGYRVSAVPRGIRLGTFRTAATIRGSNVLDPDPTQTGIALPAAGLKEILESCLWVSPAAGAGVTDVDVYLLVTSARSR